MAYSTDIIIFKSNRTLKIVKLEGEATKINTVDSTCCAIRSPRSPRGPPCPESGIELNLDQAQVPNLNSECWRVSEEGRHGRDARM